MTLTNDTDKMGDRQLMRYFDNDLSAAEMAQVAERLLRDADARDKLAGLTFARDLLSEMANDDGRADGIADAVLARVQSENANSAPSLVANDNSRAIWFMVAVAAAMAAGVFFWFGRVAQSPTVAGTHGETPSTILSPERPPKTLSSMQRGRQLALRPSASPSESVDDAPVEIDDIEFGAGQSGAVFYVASHSNQSSKMAVLWITDTEIQ